MHPSTTTNKRSHTHAQANTYTHTCTHVHTHTGTNLHGNMRFLQQRGEILRSAGTDSLPVALNRSFYTETTEEHARDGVTGPEQGMDISKSAMRMIRNTEMLRPESAYLCTEASISRQQVTKTNEATILQILLCLKRSNGKRNSSGVQFYCHTQESS